MENETERDESNLFPSNINIVSLDNDQNSPEQLSMKNETSSEHYSEEIILNEEILKEREEILKRIRLSEGFKNVYFSFFLFTYICDIN
jgi:hypothetical protein